MPVYEFKCPECGARDEIEETMAAIGAAEVWCTEESCWKGAFGSFEGVRMKRVFSPVGAVFKGSGFYRNDSRPKPEPEAKPVEKKKESTSD